MKNFLKLLLLCLSIYAIFKIKLTDAFAYVSPGSIRIGIEYKYKNVASVPIDNTNIIVGFEIDGRFTACAEFNSASYSIISSDSYYVRSQQMYASYELAKHNSSMFASSGLISVVGVKGPGEFYIYFGGYNSLQEAESVAVHTRGTVVNPSTRRTALTSAGQITLIFDNDTLFPQVSAGSAVFVNLGDRKYRGIVEFNRSSGKITAINVCTVDEYLFSVVPPEMSSGWHMEALKAQVVAARSYMLSSLSGHKGDEYNICDLAHCQIYRGASQEMEQINSAVTLTSGIVALYNDMPINAVFFSSSGGQTDDSENVWNEYVPYLRSVNDSIEAEPKIWSRTFSLNEINGLLQAKNKYIGNVLSVSIKIGASNRVLEMIIQGSAGVETLTKENIRNFFSATTQGPLDSRFFNIENGIITSSGAAFTQTADSVFRIQGSVASIDAGLASAYVYIGNAAAWPMNDFMNSGSVLSAASAGGISNISAVQSTGSGTVITGGQNGYVTFNGKGYGHGVGMSQYGAKSMAEAGYDFKSILRKYYSGVYFSNE